MGGGMGGAVLMMGGGMGGRMGGAGSQRRVTVAMLSGEFDYEVLSLWNGPIAAVYFIGFQFLVTVVIPSIA